MVRLPLSRVLVFTTQVPTVRQLHFPDPQPLVERFGRDFFRASPECPGVYLMRDAADGALYVGEAKNRHKRLASIH